jgi:glycosyltransferase involved in cell wall biosynthesis
MRVLILTDTMFAAREWEMLSRVEIGLAAEGVQVVHAMPTDAVAHVLPGGSAAGELPVFSTLIPFTPSSVPFTLGLRAQRLLDAVRERLDLEDEERGFDLVHAFGGGVVPLALEAARREGTPVVVEVWRSGMASRLHSLLRGYSRDGRAAEGTAGRAGGRGGVILSAPDGAIEKEIIAADLPGHPAVRVVPWGVHMPEWVRAMPFAASTFSAMIIGSGHDPGALASALEGLARACPPGRELLVFVDADAGRRGRLWRVANRLGITGAVSFVDNLEARRDLLVAGDILLAPEARGEHRTALLEAFACEMLVVAAKDPRVSWLRDGETARLVEPGDPRGWETAIRGLTEAPGVARSLAQSAKLFVSQRHLASSQLLALVELYQWAAGSMRLTPA